MSGHNVSLGHKDAWSAGRGLVLRVPQDERVLRVVLRQAQDERTLDLAQDEQVQGTALSMAMPRSAAGGRI